MPSDSFRQRQVPWIKYSLIGLVVLYLIWLLGLPVMTLIGHAAQEGWGSMASQLGREEVWYAFGLTLLLCVSAVFLNTIFGTAVALVLVRQKFWGRRIINGIIDLPFALSAVVVGYMFILLFGRGGWLEGVNTLTGIRWVFSVPGMILATLFVTFPFVVRELIPVLQEVGTEQEEAARTLGAGGWKTFWKVTLPNIQWGLLYGMSLTFARALGEFGAVLVVGAGIAGATETATIFVFRAMEERMYAGAYGASLILIVFAFLLLMGMEVLKKRRKAV